MQFATDFQPWSDVCGITRSHVIAALGRPDHQQLIEVEGLILRLSTKYVPNTKPPTELLVMESTGPGSSELDVFAAIKVYEDFVTPIHEILPLDLLKEVSIRFGCDMHVGPITRKLFLHETLPLAAEIDPGRPPVAVTCSGTGEGLQVSFVRVNAPDRTLRVAMMFCLDVALYKGYLARRGSM